MQYFLLLEHRLAVPPLLDKNETNNNNNGATNTQSDDDGVSSDNNNGNGNNDKGVRFSNLKKNKKGKKYLTLGDDYDSDSDNETNFSFL